MFIKSSSSFNAKKKLEMEKQKELNEIMQFAGILNGETKKMSAKEIKARKVERYIFPDKK